MHVLTVHGVGRHDHLSNLLLTYQSIRANVTSVEAPVTVEDQIPGWRLVQFEEGAEPPFLKLEPRVEPQPGSVGAVYLYEVNYSGLAGVIRQNHPIDLTDLFLGLDLAVAAARQRPITQVSSVLGGNTRELAACVQRVAGVLTAGTVPIIGLPSLVFREYIGTFIATFTRFFEDVATFALDKNGEQLISTHLDRTVSAIVRAMAPGDRLVMAAHSLGSVVVHDFIVRQRHAHSGPLPDTVVTFGSPIGLLSWLWLFLDFEDMRFLRRVSGDRYFCWNPVSQGVGTRKVISWLNAVNCVDPIATAFPMAALDLSSAEADIASGLDGGTICHRYFGDVRVAAVGESHTAYLNDKDGFVAMLLRAAGLASGDPKDVLGTRSAAEHWEATERVLSRAQWGLLGVALVAIVVYCGVTAYAFHDRRALWSVPIFAWPAATIGVLSFFQRLALGGPTKRIPVTLIQGLRWWGLASFPYRLREELLALVGRSRDIDPMAASPRYVTRLFISLLSFLPTLAGMSIPVIWAAWLTNHWPSPASLWSRMWTLQALLALASGMIYVVACAGHELVRTWRQVLRIVNAE